MTIESEFWFALFLYVLPVGISPSTQIFAVAKIWSGHSLKKFSTENFIFRLFDSYPKALQELSWKHIYKNSSLVARIFVYVLPVGIEPTS